MMRSFFITGLLLLTGWIAGAADMALPGINSTLRFMIDHAPVDGKIESKGKELIWRYQDITCRIEIIPKGTGREVALALEVPKQSKSLHRMHVILTGESNLDGTVYYFNGAQTEELKTAAERNIWYDTMPQICVYNKLRGMSLAITPDSIVGEFFSSAKRVGEKVTLSLKVPVVVDAKKVQDLKFFVLDYQAEFGMLDALETYYNAYPDFFKAPANINQDIYGVGGYYLPAGSQHPLQLHAGRRSHLNWEWTYAPWIEAGNWYTTKDQWKDGESEILNFYALREHKKGSFEEFSNHVKTQFDVGSRGAAMYFYVLVKDMMMSLGDRYPEARFADAKGEDKRPGGLFSIEPNRNKTYMTWAPGTGLMKHVEEQIKLCAENYKIDGFAFDMANYAVDNYGKGQMDYAVGRTFDHNGKIYTPDTILPIPFADYIHTLKSFRDERLTVYMNMALEMQSPFGVFHADGVMFEGGPEAEMDHIATLRMFSGRKPMTFWGGVGNGDMHTSIAWNKIKSPEMKRELYEQLASLMLLKCYQYGITPMNWAVCYGDGKYYQDHLSPLIAIKKLGWNPVPAMRGEGTQMLYLGRFGYGENTVLTISNPQREAFAGQIEVLTKYFGDDAAYILIPHHQNSLKQRFENGVIRFDLKLAPKELAVFTVVKLQPSATFDAQVESNGYLDNSITLSGLSGEHTMTLRMVMPNGYVLDDLMQNNTSVALASSLKISNNTTIKASYVPPTVVFPDNAAVGRVFKASDQLHGKKNAVIVTPEKMSRDIESIKIMVDRYYPYCYASKLYCGKNWTQETGFLNEKYTTSDPVAVVHTLPEKGKAVVIGTPDDFPELAAKLPTGFLETTRRNQGGWVFAPDKKIVWIGGFNDAEMRKAADRYFSILDERN